MSIFAHPTSSKAMRLVATVLVVVLLWHGHML